MLDVKAKGDGAQRLRQLPPQQNLLQLGGRSVLLEGCEDRFWVSLVGRVRRLLRARQRDGSPGLWRVDGVGGGRRLSGGLHMSRGARGVLGWERMRVFGRLCGGWETLEGVVVGEGVGGEGVEGGESARHCKGCEGGC